MSPSKSSRLALAGVLTLAASLLAGAPATDAAVTTPFTPPGLDATFGAGGRAEPPADTSFLARVTAVLPDGAVIVAGTVASGAGTDVSVVRYTTGGLLDGTFGTSGRTVFDVGVRDGVGAIVVQPDGAIVLAGTTSPDFTSASMFIARLLPSGAVDSGFGTSGVTTTAFAAAAGLVVAVGRQSTGALVVGATSHDLHDSASDMLARRYTAGGTLDTTFGTSGLATVDFGGRADAAGALVVLPDDSIVLAGTSAQTSSGTVFDQQFALAKLDAGGVAIAGFGVSGQRRTVVAGGGYGTSIVVTATGDLVVGGSGNNATNALYPHQHMAFARYTSAGTLDPSFGSNGVVVHQMLADYPERVFILQGASALVQQADGKLVAVGGLFNAIRMHADGALDTRFGIGGKVYAPFGPGTYAQAGALTPDGRLVAVGASIIARYRAGAPLVTLQTPVRLLDTRRSAKPATGSITRVATGHPGNEAAFVNITLVESAANGYATAAPCADLSAGAQQFSNANAVVERVRANESLVRLDPDGAFCVYLETAAHLVIDLQGTVGESGTLGIESTPADRILDTRTGFSGPAQAGTITRVGTRLRPRYLPDTVLAPAGSRAVVVNITTLGATSPGYITAGPCATLTATSQPVSTANATPGEDLANTAIVEVDPNGDFCIYTETTMHLLVDITAAFVPTGGSGIHPVSPRRLFDSRANATPGIQASQNVPFATNVVPSVADGSFVNVTATNAAAAGFATASNYIFYGEYQRPESSSVNYRPGQNTANLVAVPSNDTMYLYTSATTDLVVDLQAIY